MRAMTGTTHHRIRTSRTCNSTCPHGTGHKKARCPSQKSIQRNRSGVGRLGGFAALIFLALQLGVVRGWAAASSTRHIAALAEADESNQYFVTLPPHSSLPSGAHCAAIIPATPETIPGNVPFNRTTVSPEQLRQFAARGYTFETLSNYVQFERIQGNYTGSTDMIMRWVACKYGIDEDVVRGQAWQESGWWQWQTGDKRHTRSQCVQDGFTTLWDNTIVLINGKVVSCPECCWTSWSAWQTKVYYEWKTWPMIKDSTSFAGEFRFAEARACMDGAYAPYFAGRRPHEGHNTYEADLRRYDDNPTEENLETILWGCIGAHYSGDWYDRPAIEYVSNVRGNIAHRRWRTPTIRVTGP